MTQTICPPKQDHMTPLRRKRLLFLAQTPNADHKRWYSQYCQLAAEGLTGWALGFAWLTDKGRKALEEME